MTAQARQLAFGLKLPAAKQVELLQCRALKLCSKSCQTATFGGTEQCQAWTLQLQAGQLRTAVNRQLPQLWRCNAHQLELAAARH